jgi:hypothetical protein
MDARRIIVIAHREWENEYYKETPLRSTPRANAAQF